jgi:GrpE
MPPLDPLPADDEFLETEDDSEVTLELLHEELVATTAETRRGNRRVLEVLKNLSGVLDALSATSNDTHKALRALPALTSTAPAAGSGLPHVWALALVELADRLDRVAHGFTCPPSSGPSWWPGARRKMKAWRDAWETQADAISILRSHLAATLQRADLERLEVVGRPFDPNTMTAVESTVDLEKPDHTVLAETLPGWRNTRSGQLVRPAQVQVSRLAVR